MYTSSFLEIKYLIINLNAANVGFVDILFYFFKFLNVFKSFMI